MRAIFPFLFFELHDYFGFYFGPLRYLLIIQKHEVSFFFYLSIYKSALKQRKLKQSIIFKG